MFQKYIDKTIIELIVILVAGAGLFAILTKYSVPELNATFFGKNVFADKRDIIDTKMTWIFTFLAIVGVLIQVYSVIFCHNLQERLYSSKYYASFFAIGIIFMAFVVFFLGCFGKFIARKQWFPVVISEYKEAFELSMFIIENDGWRKDQLEIKDKLSDSEKYRDANYKQADEIISIIEKILELPRKDNDLTIRGERIKKYFK